MSNNTGIPFTATETISTASNVAFAAAFRTAVLAGKLPIGDFFQIGAVYGIVMVKPSRKYRGRKLVEATVIAKPVADVDADVTAAIANKDAVVLASGRDTAGNVVVCIGFYSI